MCIIVYHKLNKNIILAKNRDRNYKPKIFIIHKLLNGVEIAYIIDNNTNWVEGLNEHGFGIINSSLRVDYDEDPLSNNIMDLKEKKISQQKYLNALSTCSINYFQDKVFDKKYWADISLQGHNIVANPYFGFVIESNNYNNPIIKMINDTCVRTNHGIGIKNTGYKDGLPLISSILRKQIIEAEFKNNNIEDYNDIFNLMNQNYDDLDIDLQPYRSNPKYFFTTSQLILDLTDKKLVFNFDKDYCIFNGIINKLPSNYKPKIQIIVNSTKKNMTKKNIPLNKTYMKKILNKLNVKTKNSI